MERVKPSPVLHAAVVVIKHPLKPFQVLLQHFLLNLFALFCVYVEFHLHLVVASFSFEGVFSVLLDKIDHEFIVLFTIFLGKFGLNKDFIVEFSVNFSLEHVLQVQFFFINITNIGIRDIFRVQVG